MRAIAIFLPILLVSFSAIGQSSKIDYILKSKVETVQKISTENTPNTIFLKSTFADFHIENSNKELDLENTIITQVALIYTTYKESPTFSQTELNHQRLQSLQKLNPYIFQNDLIEWKFVAQTACSTASEGKEFFHGFAITYRPEASEETMEKEIDFIEKALSGKLDVSIEMVEADDEAVVSEVVESSLEIIDPKSVPHFIGGNRAYAKYIEKELKYPEKAKKEGKCGMVSVSFVVDKDGEVKGARLLNKIGSGCDEEALRVVSDMPKWSPATYEGTPVSSTYTLGINFNLSELDGGCKSYSGAYPFIADYMRSTGTSTASFSIWRNPATDSTVYKTFARNPQWEKMHVVCDFTGSMSPYTAQLLVWHKLNFNANKTRIEHFTFFNDGDKTPDRQKKIGRVGGIYQSKAGNFDEIKALAQQTMRGGCGGDAPENNVEALLKAIEACPECEDYVMIADNYATPRDLSLLEEVHKPVKIIVCGAYGGINPAYLTMARKLGGSVHTMEDDIENLLEINEGEMLTLNNQTYKVLKGEFVRVYGM